jgi:hypothetical protein
MKWGDKLPESDNVNNIETLALELGDYGGEGVVGGRDVVVGSLDTSTQ